MNNLDLLDIKEISARNISLFFSEMIGLEAELVDHIDSHVEDGPQIVSRIILSGFCDGTILVTSDLKLATKLASIALETEPQDISLNDIMDVIGEMNNMVVGNLRSVMSNIGIECKLCTPSVSTEDSRASIPEIQSFDQIVYRIDGLPIVTLIKLVPGDTCVISDDADAGSNSDEEF